MHLYFSDGFGFLALTRYQYLRRLLMGHSLGLLKVFFAFSLPTIPSPGDSHGSCPAKLLPSLLLHSAGRERGMRDMPSTWFVHKFLFNEERSPFVTVLVLTGIELITLLCVMELCFPRDGWIPVCPWEVLNESLVFILPVCMTSTLPSKPWILSLLLFWFSHTSQFSGLANVYSVLKTD